MVMGWERWRDELSTLHLVMVGEFEPQDPVPPEVRDVLRTDSRIHLTGWIQDVAPFYAAMDVVVLPSYREGLPVVPLEAAAMALPVAATRIPGSRDAVEHGVT